MKYLASISSFRHPNPFLDLQVLTPVLTPDRMLYELCTLLLMIRRPLGQVAEAGVASMQPGVSMELMLCGLLTFMLGFFLMPWVLDLACVFLFVGFVTNLSGIGRAILCWPAVCEVLSHKEVSTCLGGFGAKSNSPVHHQVSFTEKALPQSPTREMFSSANQIPAHDCSGGNYSSASSYHQSLELLSATLPQKASLAPRLFARASVVIGEATYALAQCRGDIDSASCSTCIHRGLQDAEVSCGLRKELFVAYDLCTLQLSDTVISWPYQMNISVVQLDNVTVQSEAFDLGIGPLSAGVGSMAAHRPERFATAVEEIAVNGKNYTAYGLAQCTPELTPADCVSCLEELSSVSTLIRRSGGWFSTTWCSYQL
ncbi:hypothetical protein ACQ4PT_019495 [Festuca glaucescens]